MSPGEKVLEARTYAESKSRIKVDEQVECCYCSGDQERRDDLSIKISQGWLRVLALPPTVSP